MGEWVLDWFADAALEPNPQPSNPLLLLLQLLRQRAWARKHAAPLEAAPAEIVTAPVVQALRELKEQLRYYRPLQEKPSQISLEQLPGPSPWELLQTALQ